MTANVEVALVAEKKEWAGEGSDDEDPVEMLEQQASEAFEAREKRLTVGAEVVISDVAVALLAEKKEWAGDSTGDESSGEEDNVEVRELRVSVAFQAREKRLSV